jgi:hypothetical protein
VIYPHPPPHTPPPSHTTVHALPPPPRGSYIHRYSTRETFIAYWGMGLYWGKASSNNKKGHMIGHIKDIGQDPANPLTRLYATHAAQPFHNDSAGNTRGPGGGERLIFPVRCC